MAGDCRMVDIFRSLHPGREEFTWASTDGSWASRIDFLFAWGFVGVTASLVLFRPLPAALLSGRGAGGVGGAGRLEAELQSVGEPGGEGGLPGAVRPLADAPGPLRLESKVVGGGEGEEPLAQVLRRDAWISGVGIPGSGGMEARCILYMDDVTVCCTDATSVGRVLDRTEWFGRASGARLNRDKTTLKVYGRWTETDLRDLPLTVTPDNVRILGVNFDSEGLGGGNWEGILTKGREPTCPVRGLALGQAEEVWKADQLNRHRDLAWLVAHGVLPVRAVMHARHLAQTAECPRTGCGGEETVFHALWDCGVAQKLWRAAQPLMEQFWGPGRGLDCGMTLYGGNLEAGLQTCPDLYGAGRSALGQRGGAGQMGVCSLDSDGHGQGGPDRGIASAFVSVQRDWAWVRRRLLFRLLIRFRARAQLLLQLQRFPWGHQSQLILLLSLFRCPGRLRIPCQPLERRLALILILRWPVPRLQSPQLCPRCVALESQPLSCRRCSRVGHTKEVCHTDMAKYRYCASADHVSQDCSRDPVKRAALFSSLSSMQGDVFLLQEGGHRLEVIRELPGCLSTSRSLILGGNFNVCIDVGRGGERAGEGGVDYSARALEGVVGDFGLTDAFRTAHPGNAGYTWRNSRGALSRLDYIFVGGGICGMKCVFLPSWASDHDMLQVSLPTDGPKWGSGFWRLNTLLLEADAFKAAFTSFYRSVRTLRSMYVSEVEWWEVAKCRSAKFCRRFAAATRRRDRAGVAKWTADLSYLHRCFNRGEHVDWALYEGVKERLRGLLEARAKALAFQARLRESEEGEKPSAYFFQAARARWSAPAFVGLKTADGTVAEGSAMLAVAEAYYAELFRV
ncbi:hypothetical protein AAFF_G00419030 [Aldrovandia affinis]|uniref:Reverse transcriptase zinc-binding domain-containing protein n=1 Tax=Aldrovandia affinis TaxID=143900 RepID=A0AAD7SC95_9TELE|nr:hypothetical protein AAFF_G00419030 [Aldrovandia affinis]